MRCKFKVDSITRRMGSHQWLDAGLLWDGYVDPMHLAAVGARDVQF